MNTRNWKPALLTLTAAFVAANIYFGVPAVKARTGPPRLVVDGVVPTPLSPQGRRNGYDTCLLVRVHYEGRVPEYPNLHYVADSREIKNMQVVSLSNGKEKVITQPGGKAISGAATSNRPGDSYFTVWLACRSLPPGNYKFRANVSNPITYNVYKNGKAVSSTERVFAVTPISYPLPNVGQGE